MHRFTALACLLTLGLAAIPAGDNDGFKPMFNGKDLTGWVNVNCAPGTFYIKDDMVITTGKPTGYLRTDRHYENFIAEFDWFHAPSPKGSVGNSGFFVWCDPIPVTYDKIRADGKKESIHSGGYTRGIEVQVLVNLLYTDKKTGLPTATSYGDLFSIHGATCKPDRPHPTGSQRCIPSENNCKGEFEWNHYKVVANNGVIKLTVNGKEVSGVSECNPRKGYLALESEGSECRFKNLKIKELPSTNPKPSEICDVDKGWKSLFTGLNLDGWKVTDDQKKRWRMNDGVLSFDGKGLGKAARTTLWSETSLGDFELVCDWKFNSPGQGGLVVRGSDNLFAQIQAQKKEIAKWHRTVLRVKGNLVTRTEDGKVTADKLPVRDLPARGPIGLVQEDGGGQAQFRNVFVRELKADE